MRPYFRGDTRIIELLGNIRREYCAVLDSNHDFLYQNIAFKKLMKAYEVQNFESLALSDLLQRFEGAAFLPYWQDAIEEVSPENPHVEFSYYLDFGETRARIQAEIQAVYEDGDLLYLAIGMDEVTDIYLKHRFEKLKSNFLTRAIQVSDEDELMWVLVDELLSKLYFEDALILKRKGDLLIPVAAHGNQRKGEKGVKSLVKVPVNIGVTGRVVETGEPYMTGNCAEDEYYISRYFNAGSEVAVPIFVRGKVFGVINCESQQLNFFRPVHQELLAKAAEVLQHRIEEINSRAELMKLEQRHLAIINSTPNSFLLFDEDFLLMSYNTAAKKAWSYFSEIDLKEGAPKEEVIPESLWKVFGEMGELSLQGEHKQEFLNWHRKGQNYHLKLSFAPAHNPEGEIFGFTMLVEDVTELHKANEALRDKNSNLERSNKELDKFVYSISHDLRAPLSSIMGLVNLIENSQHLPETKIYGKMLQDATESMDSYIRNILEYSRNKRLDIEMLEVNVEQMLLDAHDKFRFIPGYRELKFETNLQVQKIVSDPYRVEIILNNLITNAIKYRDVRKPESWCKVEVSEQDDYWQIIIADNGIGIPPEKHPQLFDMFFKVKSEHPGSGLGLYILKEVVDNLNGKAEVSSEVKKGTTFTILLPKEGMHG